MTETAYDRLTGIDNSFLVYEDASPNGSMHVASTQIHEAAPLRSGDGSIDILDALAASQHSVGLITLSPGQLVACDVDASGSVTVTRIGAASRSVIDARYAL